MQNLLNRILFLLIILLIAIAVPGFFMFSLKVMLSIVLGFILLLVIAGLALRSKIKQMMRDAEQQMGGSSQGQGGFYSFTQRGGQTSKPSDEQDDVKIFKQKGSGEKKVSRNVGDYVDFEEVKEE
ncbi:MAG: DUF4834 family protein [Rikenellaceae bacterium]